ncbi:MAG: glycosyltransferase family 2 protein [Candidatus Pacearchaeota archaeon]
MKISIAILTKNAGSNFQRVLEQIFKQKEKDFEVIIIDSGSTDKTLEIAKRFPSKIYKINPEEFNHGKIRNFAAKIAKSKYIVYLTQDAIPANEFWLSNLLKNFKDKKVAAVFSRQIPRKNASLIEIFFNEFHFPNQKIIRPNKDKAFMKSIFFSNVSSCIKRDILLNYPFDEKLIMSEDQQFARDVIKAGYKTVYEPKSEVIHSHDYTLVSVFQRYFDSAFSLKEITKESDKKFLDYGLNYTSSLFAFIIKNNPLLIPYTFFYCTSMFLGTFLGTNQKYIPLFIKKIFSMHKNYWKNVKNIDNRS